MQLDGLKVGFALTGSFCTLEKVIPEIDRIVKEGADVYPIISEAVDKLDTRFGEADKWKSRLRDITGREAICSIIQAEPIGPKAMLDILVVAPCTGNTISKLANAITDTSVTMACKAHLRNQKPLVLAISTNDGLGMNAKNIGMLMNMKNIYMVPFEQDDPIKKCNSLMARNDLIIPTILESLKGKQIQPVLV
ncbi:dipicolinate synthase subunit B [Anaerobacterium chartisolvens]|uniref:Dipicolinate synthase subunit B n=1 Tax=Anaerobacterium chartisolvens TaxID=1297424 RepID=A0A369AWU5_9FIRM|nr:dipicolinate synthase subunit B [Anaerobacterium chartisolvens]RCX13870.1 dipicolinate synthase subunit B [Anaerobacterium chartisolvens]